MALERPDTITKGYVCMYVILEQEPDLQTRKKNLKNPQNSYIII